jgi:hypothetical protein
MRKGKRFTPALLERWKANGRGLGVKGDYVPWHMVSRGDPGSQGRSHLVNWLMGRQHHLLSDQELVVFGFVTMLPQLVDVREQFPLSHDTHVCELAAYQWLPKAPEVPGTLEIAKELGLKHPLVHGDGVSASWVMTTDLVVAITMPHQRCGLLAISVKTAEEAEDRRTRELLRIEREYWRRQDVTWLLVTSSMFESPIKEMMQSAMSWAIRTEPTDEKILSRLQRLSAEAAMLEGMTLPAALMKLQSDFAMDLEDAQLLFWTAVWESVIPLDLAMPLRPAAVIRLLSKDEFIQQNPVASRRTAWMG